MPVEIERKFLVTYRWQPSGLGVQMAQGYLSTVPERTVRVRIANEVAFITVKGIVEGLTRPEFEYRVPVEDAREMMKLCEQPPIIKRRYDVPVGAHVWEVDVFEGANAGLIVAEVELQVEDEPFVMPDWVGAEVSADRRYSNSRLAQTPFETWGGTERSGHYL